MRSLAAQMIADGTIDPTAMSGDQFRAAFIPQLQSIRHDSSEFTFILDHQDSVLPQARDFEESGKEDFALISYATWIEHRLNDMFVWNLKRIDKPQAEAVKLVRTTS